MDLLIPLTTHLDYCLLPGCVLCVFMWKMISCQCFICLFLTFVSQVLCIQVSIFGYGTSRMSLKMNTCKQRNLRVARGQGAQTPMNPPLENYCCLKHSAACWARRVQGILLLFVFSLGLKSAWVTVTRNFNYI